MAPRLDRDHVVGEPKGPAAFVQGSPGALEFLRGLCCNGFGCHGADCNGEAIRVSSKNDTPTRLLSKVGESLEKRRDKLGISQAKFAQQLKLPNRQRYYQIVHSNPDLPTMEGLAGALGCTVSDLTGEKDPPPTLEEQLVAVLGKMSRQLDRIEVALGGMSPPKRRRDASVAQ